jgi:predicted dinucleotide-binding enzyme
MRIGVLGTGMVGRALSGKLAELKHDVMMGTRDVDALLARQEDPASGGETFADWRTRHPDVLLSPFPEAAANAELIFNATSGLAALEALDAAGDQNLNGKILLDISNPLDFSRGMPPFLSVSNMDSLGEQIQRAHPGARVVKTLNTVNAHMMVDPQSVAGGDHQVFVSGDDPKAKEEVTGILRDWFGWRNILDLGDITTARGTEMYLALWIRMLPVLGTAMFNVKIVQ